MKIRVDGTFQRITFDPMQNVYIGIQCLDFSECPGVTELICSECPFTNNTEVNLEDIIKVYLKERTENEDN